MSPSKSGRRNRGRVFILGAGVSAACGIAVASRILRESVMRLERAALTKADRIHKLLGYLYPDFCTRLRNYPNVEDFLNLLEMARRFNTEEFIASLGWSKTRLDEVKQITLSAVTDYIWDLMTDSDKQRLIRDFVREQLQVGDTIITFNWDLTIERALEESPGGPEFLYSYSRTREHNAFSLLKPHGSIDWFERRAVRDLVSEKNLGKLDNQLYYYPHFDRGANPKLREVLPVIVPPVATKEYEFEFLKRTWRFVYRAVRDATELHIIGYSLPREDQFSRLVFRRAMLNNIAWASKGAKRQAKVIVVNPDPAAEGTFSRLVGRENVDFAFHQAYFEDYVAGLQE